MAATCVSKQPDGTVQKALVELVKAGPLSSGAMAIISKLPYDEIQKALGELLKADIVSRNGNLYSISKAKKFVLVKEYEDRKATALRMRPEYLDYGNADSDRALKLAWEKPSHTFNPKKLWDITSTEIAPLVDSGALQWVGKRGDVKLGNDWAKMKIFSGCSKEGLTTTDQMTKAAGMQECPKYAHWLLFELEKSHDLFQLSPHLWATTAP
jgi:hypothetical protein